MRKTYVLFLMGWCACTQSSQPPVVSEFQFETVGHNNQALGSDCTKAGSSACVSGLCLHTGLEKDSGFICTKVCGSEADCRQGWACVALGTAQDESVCIPQVAEASQP